LEGAPIEIHNEVAFVSEEYI